MRGLAAIGPFRFYLTFLLQLRNEAFELSSNLGAANLGSKPIKGFLSSQRFPPHKKSHFLKRRFHDADLN